MARPFFRRRKSCPFQGKDAPVIDYKDVRLLQGYISERGKIVPSRITAVSAKKQRAVPRGTFFNGMRNLRLLSHHLFRGDRQIMRPFIALVLGLATFDIEALAQVASEEDDSAGVICVGGHRWQPTPEDSLKIESFPVPESFRLRFESSGTCVRWGIRLDDGIVDWHLRFGSAQSVSNALGYIKDNSKDVPSPATYLPLLRRSVAAALPDLKRAAALKQPPGLSYSVRYRFMEQSKPVARFRELLRARDDHLFLARNYLRAAEEYTDPALLAKADSYISSLDATAAFLAACSSLIAAFFAAVQRQSIVKSANARSMASSASRRSAVSS